MALDSDSAIHVLLVGPAASAKTMFLTSLMHQLKRFFVVELEPYEYEQFFDIAEKLLSRHKIEGQVASAIADAVWKKSRDIRDCRKIGALAKTMTDVEFILDKFFGPKTRQGDIQT